MRRMLAIAAAWGLFGVLLAAGCSGSPDPAAQVADRPPAPTHGPAFSPCFAGATPAVVRPVRLEELTDPWWEEFAATDDEMAASSVPRMGYFELPPPP